MGILIERLWPPPLMNLSQIHTPVMLERTLELLAPSLSGDNAVCVDATLGMGGHTEAMLERFPNLTVIGLDRDPDALAIAGERLARFGDRFKPVHTVYDGIAEAVAASGFREITAVLFDLGVSSLQLDRAERGFAYSKDAPLDMRMDASTGQTAADVIATASEDELRGWFQRYGEEKLSGRYAKAIVTARAEAPILRSAGLVEILTAVTPVAVQRQGHPAKRVFQALRIVVNDELGALERAIPASLELLARDGRIVVLAYQSLEDRFVKRLFQAATTSSAPADLPMELPEHRPQFRALVRGAELASAEEQERNPRARPVRLRAIERIRSAA